MNRLYNPFDAHKWIVFSGADYLSDNEDFMMIIFNDFESPKVSAHAQLEMKWRALWIPGAVRVAECPLLPHILEH